MNSQSLSKLNINTYLEKHQTIKQNGACMILNNEIKTPLHFHPYSNSIATRLALSLYRRIALSTLKFGPPLSFTL
ncbi:hypothetical protein LguiB_000854 [Lonicera macranthoides]